MLIFHVCETDVFFINIVKSGMLQAHSKTFGTMIIDDHIAMETNICVFEKILHSVQVVEWLHYFDNFKKDIY